MEETEHRNSKGRFKPGHPGGPGRAKGAGLSIKEKINQYFRDHPDELQRFAEKMIKQSPELTWQMLEGRPSQDVTSGGDKLIPNPIFGGLSVKVDGLPEHNSNEENLLPEVQNPSS